MSLLAAPIGSTGAMYTVRFGPQPPHVPQGATIQPPGEKVIQVQTGSLACRLYSEATVLPDCRLRDMLIPLFEDHALYDIVFHDIMGDATVEAGGLGAFLDEATLPATNAEEEDDPDPTRRRLPPGLLLRWDGVFIDSDANPDRDDAEDLDAVHDAPARVELVPDPPPGMTLDEAEMTWNLARIPLCDLESLPLRCDPYFRVMGVRNPDVVADLLAQHAVAAEQGEADESDLDELDTLEWEIVRADRPMLVADCFAAIVAAISTYGTPRQRLRDLAENDRWAATIRDKVSEKLSDLSDAD